MERALEDMSDDKSFKVGGSKLGASFLGEATLLVVKKVIVETVTKTKATKLHCAMKVSKVLKWLRSVNQLCEGDMETYRTLVFLQAAGEKAFLVREELQAQPQNEEPLNAVLKGMFGVKWQKALRKEWRDMAGRTDGRELWAEVQMVGLTLGETLEQQKRKFFKVLPEEVQAQLVSRYLGEEAVLKLDWEDKMLLEVTFLWKSGKPTLSVPEQPPLRLPRLAAGQPPAHFHQQMSFQPPANFHPFGQFYPHRPYQPNGAFQQWQGGQGAFRGNPCENFHAGGNQGPPAAGGVVGGNQAPPANGGANERNQAPPATGGASARNQAPLATGGAATGDQAPQGGKGNAGVSGDHPLCTFCKSRQHRTENCILNPQSRGYMHHMVCFSCGMRGHPARLCNNMFRQMNKDGNSGYPVWICELSAEEKEKKDEQIRIPMEVGGLVVDMWYDTGAERSHCTVRWALRHGLRWVKRVGIAVTQSGKEVAIRGEAVVKFKYAGRVYMQKWLVLAGEQDFAAISEEDGRKLGIYVMGIALLHSGVGSGVVDNREWLEEGEEGLGKEVRLSEEQLKIIDEIVGGPLAENVKLPDKSFCNDRALIYSFDVPTGMVVYKSQYHQTQEVKYKIHLRIREWVAKGFCKRVRVGNLNNLLLLLVAKVDGGKVNLDEYRVCLDARPLNEKNNSKSFSLPKIADIIKKVTKATMMADLDLQNAFHQVLLDKVLSDLSAFTDPLTGEHYQMSKMWFGESGSATQMQKVVHSVLGVGEEGTEDWQAYVDNMLVLYEGEDVREFVNQVKTIVEKLTAKGLKLKPAKCKVGYLKMRILGHLCEKGVARIDPVKVECFSKMECPKSLQAVQLILGFLNYVRDYVPIIADLLGPFQELAKRRKWDDTLWTPKMDNLFKRVGKVLESAPVLSVPDFGVPFIVATDVSQYGVGAVLYQVVGGKKKFIGFGAKALQKGQKNYPAPKRELLAMLFGLRRWGEMLQPQEFTVEVDHKALVHLRSERSFMARDWMNYVAGFNFRVRHCPGLKHVLPHHLSHLYGILPGGEREKREEAFEVERKEREEEKRDERAERARKKKERGSGEVSTKERVEVAEMTTRSRVRERVAEGSSKKREKRRQRRKNQKEKMKEGQTRVLNKGVSTGKGEEGREKKEEKGDEQEGEVGLGEERGKEEEGEREEGEEGVGEVEEEGGEEEEEEGGEKKEEGEEGEVGVGEIEEEEEREEGEEGEEGEVGVGEVEEEGGEEEGEVGGGEIEEEEGEEEEEEGGDKQEGEVEERGEGGEKEREREGRSEEGKEVGVQHLRVSDVPTKDLRMLEKRFAEEIMGAKWVEGEQDRQKLLAKVHGKAHEGEGKLFMRLLAEGWYWTDMKRDCRREAAGCRMCLQYNVGQKGFHVMRSRGVVYPMQTCHTDHLMGLEKAGPGREVQDVLVVLDSATRLVWLRAVKMTTTEETI